MSIARLSMTAVVVTLLAASTQSRAQAQIYLDPGYSNGPPVFSTPPQYSWPNFGGPPNSYQERTYWGRFMPGRQWGRQMGYGLYNVNRMEYDPATGQWVRVQGQRWRNPITGQDHGNEFITRQNPDGSTSTVRNRYSGKVPGGGTNGIPGQAVGRP